VPFEVHLMNTHPVDWIELPLVDPAEHRVHPLLHNIQLIQLIQSI
jgi:hypothetical protein